MGAVFTAVTRHSPLVTSYAGLPHVKVARLESIIAENERYGPIGWGCFPATRLAAVLELCTRQRVGG